MKKVIVFLLGIVSLAGSVYTAIRAYTLYSYTKGTGILFVKRSVANQIKYYPYMFIAAAVLAVLGIILLLAFLMMLSKSRKNKAKPEILQSELASEAPEYIICSECGTKNKATMKFCNNCGKPIA